MYRLARPTHRTYLHALWIALIAIAAGTLALPAPAGAAVSGIAQRDPEAIAPVPSCTVNPAKELFVTDLSVVEDCFRTTWTGICPVPVAPATRGAWTFGKLIRASPVRRTRPA